MLRVVTDLRVREPKNDQAGGDQCLIAHSIVGLLTWCAVVTQPVRLHDQAKFGPEEVHTEASQSLLGPRFRKACTPNKSQEAPLQLRIREGEGMPIQNSPK